MWKREHLFSKANVQIFVWAILVFSWLGFIRWTQVQGLNELDQWRSYSGCVEARRLEYIRREERWARSPVKESVEDRVRDLESSAKERC